MLLGYSVNCMEKMISLSHTTYKKISQNINDSNVKVCNTNIRKTTWETIGDEFLNQVTHALNTVGITE